MKRNKLKIKAWLVLLAVILCTSVPFPAAVLAENPIADGFEKVQENSGLALYANEETGEIALMNRQDSNIWWSNPQDRGDEPFAKGVNKMNLSSQLFIKYIDINKKVSILNNLTGSIRKDGMKTEKTGEGVKFTFSFPEQSIIIPVLYTLGEDHLKVQILYSEIKEEGPFKLLDITLLPFLGAGNGTDEGYMLVPDGCGALINFNNGKFNSLEYKDIIYGKDAVYQETSNTILKQDVKLPVFGINKNGKGLLAIVHKGAAFGSINAWVGGQRTSYNNVFAEFIYRNTDEAKLQERSWVEKTITVTASEQNGIDSIEVRYYPLESDACDYSGMASKYRRYLTEEAGVVKSPDAGKVHFYMNIYGSVKVRKPVFLGIPAMVTEPLTTFDEASGILKELNEAGVDSIRMKLSSWTKDGMFGRIPVKPDPDGKLGGWKGLRRLMKAADEYGARLYPSFDLINVYRNGKGIYRLLHGARNILKVVAGKFEYRLSTYSINETIPPWYLLAPAMVKERAVKLAESCAREKLTGVALDTIARLLYTDFKKKGTIDRGEAEALMQQSAKAMKDAAGQQMLESANAYILASADHIVDVPMYSSKFDIEDEQVPFYQMAIHGIIPYASTPSNLSSDPETHFLRCIETGSNPYYAWIARDTSILGETRMKFLYGADYKMWKNTAVKEYLEFKSIFGALAGQTITHHGKLAKKVYETVYEDGTRILVNYNNQSVSVDGHSIDAKGYLVTGGGNGR